MSATAHLATVTTRCVLPGAAVAAIGWFALQAIAGGLGPADRRALGDAVKAEQTDPQQRIAVRFAPSNGTSYASQDDAERLDTIE
jgi:hypothetical protein